MKRITRDDLLHHVSTESPYEAVIVAAREARRLNRARLQRQSLFPPMNAGLGAGGDPTGPGGADLGDEDPLAIMGEPSSASSHDVDFPGGEPARTGTPEVKVTMQALERLAQGNVTYRISEGPVDLEED